MSIAACDVVGLPERIRPATSAVNSRCPRSSSAAPAPLRAAALAPCAPLRQRLCPQRYGFVVSGVEVDERLPVCVTTSRTTWPRGILSARHGAVKWGTSFFGPAAGSEPMYQLRCFRAGHHRADPGVDGTDAMRSTESRRRPSQPETKPLHWLPQSVPQAGSRRLYWWPVFKLNS
jgi:hypothetical protein